MACAGGACSSCRTSCADAKVCACCACEEECAAFTEEPGDLIGSLTCTVDSLRDIYTQLGARAYSVSLVWIQWSGGKRGRGVEQIRRIRKILPTPRVDDMSRVQRENTSVGMTENGSIQVSEISPRFTEDELMGLSDFGYPLPDDMEFFYEIADISADGKPARRRRFLPHGVPNYNPTAFQWWIDLIRAFPARERNGDVGT